MKIEIRPFGKTSAGEEVQEYVLENRNGTVLSLISYGAAIKSLCLPNGKDVVLGYDSIENYEKQDKYMGAIIGRCANRISDGKFSIDGKEYNLAVNDGPNHLHGGIKGFDKKVWNGRVEDDSVVFTIVSKDMEEGYPGNLEVEVKYTFTNNNEVVIDYKAVSDADTVVNLTNHSYFNLSGEDTIENHYMIIYADEYTQLDESGCSNGNVVSVYGTPFDFTRIKKIGEEIEADCEQIRNANGYDHNFVFKKDHSEDIIKTASAICGDVTLDVWTNQPGMHFYTGNFLDGVVPGKNGEIYGKRKGFAVETQDWPDAVNHDGFPSTILKKGEIYKRRTVFKVKKTAN